MTTRTAILLLLQCILLSAGCSEGRYDLFLEFPDDEAHALADEIEIWVINPEAAPCQELIDGTVTPEMTGFQAQLLMVLVNDEVSPLGQVPLGQWHFFGEVRTSAGARILRGCTPARVRLGKTTEVVILFDWICHPDPSGETPNNGLDDDCDGQTDECDQDGECDDANPCTDDVCLAHACQYLNLSDTTPCDDGLWCTMETACQDGQCIGRPTECDDGDNCTEDGCAEANGGCTHTPVTFPDAEGPPGDPTCSNSIDDDCDGLTDDDDVNCSGCRYASECDDHNMCTQESCVDNLCFNDPISDDSICDDQDQCTTQDRCQQGQCTGLLWDDDGDGFASTLCGGPDCDDTNPDVHPQAQEEGPAGAATCSDSLDNDCDGRTDLAEVTCQGIQVCSEDGWCWQNPVPHGNNQTSGSWNKNGDVFFGGFDGWVTRWFGGGFALLPRASTDNLYAVWSFSVDDLWVAGARGRLARWNGETWTDMDVLPSTDLYKIWGANPEDVWIQGFGPSGSEVHHWDGATLTKVVMGLIFEPYAMWGSAPDELWLVGSAGGVARWDGAIATYIDSQLDESLYDIQGTGPDNIWIVGTQGTVIHWNGSSLERIDTFAGDIDLYEILTVAENDIWILGEEGTLLHWDGAMWAHTEIQTQQYMGALAGGPGDIWVAGNMGRVFRTDGVSLDEVSSGMTPHLWGFYARTQNDAWAVGDQGTIGRWNGAAWSFSTDNSAESLIDVWSATSDDAWAIARWAVIRWDGTTWSPFEPASGGPWRAIDGCAEDNVWLVGNRDVPFDLYHWNGNTLQGLDVFPSGSSCTDVACISEDDVWAVGSDGLSYHWDGSAWTEVETGTTNYLRKIDGLNADDVWAIGSAGNPGDTSCDIVLHWDGLNWNPIVPDSHNQCKNVFADGTGSAWLTGGQFGARHCTTTGCTATKTDIPEATAVGGAGGSIWLVGSYGTIVHRGP